LLPTRSDIRRLLACIGAIFPIPIFILTAICRARWREPFGSKIIGRWRAIAISALRRWIIDFAVVIEIVISVTMDASDEVGSLLSDASKSGGRGTAAG